MSDTETMSSLIESDERSRTIIANNLGQTLFVEAGAGTGKTTALVGRIVELVLTSDQSVRTPLSQIAAITFTEAAAAELRERIRITFEERLFTAEAEGKSELIERCQQALADADVAAISTLHAFAQRLLSEFPVEIGVPPRVEVIDEVRSQIAFDRRWSTFLDSLYDDPNLEEFIVRASILGVKLNGPQLRNIAQDFDDNWDRLVGIEPSTAPPIPIDFLAVHEAIHQIEQLPAECSDDDDKLLEKIRDAGVAFERFRAATTDYERLRIVKLLQTQKFTHGRKGNWRDILFAKECCGQLEETCTDVINAVSSQTLARFAERIAAFTRQSAEERRAEGLLEFHDLLVLAHMLLRQSPEARAALSDRYRVLMLDEFQDTDPIQISLALLLASAVGGAFDGSWEDLQPEPGRLFMVGDPKQSIYRFRRADIELFLQARDTFSEGEVRLQRNFRTVEPIIDVVNELFATVMPEDTNAQAKYSPLIATRAPSTADHRPVTFGGPHQGTARAMREAEAADVASIISDIRSHPENWLIEEKSGWRAPQLSDITILLPTRTSMSQLSHALDDRLIPFRADTGTLVYETQEIKDLLSVLSAIDDPSDQIALVAALRSPLYACGYDDLYRFTEGGGRFDITANVPDSQLGSAVAEALEHIASLSTRRWWDEPSQLLMRVIDERYAMALPAHGRRARDTWRRIRYVVDQARAFAEAGGGDLREYLAWTQLQGKDGSRAHEPMLPEPDDDAVQIMTIHGSKGLEFPITIVSGLTTRLGRRAATNGEVLWGDSGVLPELKTSSAVRTAQFDLRKELDDEMDGPERDRLLYVALTRSRDHLAMSTHHGVNTKLEPVASHGATIFQWAAEHDGDLVRGFGGQAALFPLGSTSPTVTSDAEPCPPISLPAEWRTRHTDRLNSASTRSVVSATALAREAADRSSFGAGDGGNSDLWEPDTIDAEEQIGEQVLPPQEFRRGRAGTAIGSAVHGVLQLVDLTDPASADLAALCDSQAWAESVPEHVDTVRRSVDSVLQAPIVVDCQQARHWKELFVAAPVGDVTIEGYVDLLVETPDGLVVVDYKTDAVRHESDVDAKLERYSLQGAAYAVAVEAATGRSVVDVQFVFARPDGPIVRSIDDFQARCAQVHAAAAAGSTDSP